MWVTLGLSRWGVRVRSEAGWCQGAQQRGQRWSCMGWGEPKGLSSL